MSLSFIFSFHIFFFKRVARQQFGLTKVTKSNNIQEIQKKIIHPFHISDPDAWPSVNPTCGGLNQSPIDIHPKTSVLKSYPKLRFGEYGDVDNIKVVNNGHTG